MHTAGLTDYEVRDLNDEINKLMREKRHWENQIVALGGANYRRNVAMMDDDGKEVPGTKGYKSVLHTSPPWLLTNLPFGRYFGRAKDLPGVRELFQSKKQEQDEENQVQNYYKKFSNQGPSYFGDMDESDGSVLKFEQEAEHDGTYLRIPRVLMTIILTCAAEWEDAYQHLRSALGVDLQTPKMPRTVQSHGIAPTNGSVSQKVVSDTKRKAPEGETDKPQENGDADPKRAKKDGTPPPHGEGDTLATSDDPTLVHARTTAAYIPFLTPENLLPPKMPTREEMETFLLGLQKRALVEEYFGSEAS